MTQDTEDVVALTDEAIEAAAKQLRAVLDEGYDDECALSSALEMLGVETKAGVCPCCKRSFENLQRHMTAEHPAFGEAFDLAESETSHV